MRISLFAAAVIALAFGSCSPSTLAAQQQRPNILFFLADDQRFDTLSCAGHPIVRTPTIDRLASEGVRFRNAFVTTAVCWVSRAVIHTGQWARSHVERDAVPTIKPAALATMFSRELRQAGYRTGHFGKWHLRAAGDFKPAEQFDEFEAIVRNPYFKTLPDGSRRHETDLVCDRAIEFLQTQPKETPFCLNLAFNASHAEDGDKRPGSGHYPWPPSADGLYEDTPIPPPRLGDPAIYEAHPQFLKDSINRERYFWGYDTPEKYSTNVRAYYRMITGFDHAIGRVLATLEKTGLADNTIIVYSADNGYYLGDRGFQGKWSHFDESLRVPLVIYDPRLPKEQRGRVVDEMVLNVDLPATILDWADVARPESYEGRSLVPLVEARQQTDWRTHFFCEHVDLAPTLTWEGIRGQRWMYARYFDQRPAFEFLYDLQADPDQLVNLAADPAHAEMLKTMRALCDREINARGGPLPPLGQRGSKPKRARDNAAPRPRKKQSAAGVQSS